MRIYYDSEEPEKEISICRCEDCIYSHKVGTYKRILLGTEFTGDKYKCEKLGIETPEWFYCAYSEDTED